MGTLRLWLRHHPWWVTHAVVVVGLTGAFWAMALATPPDAGANIGAGLVALPLMPLGLPWSLAALLDPYQFDGLGRLPWLLVMFGPAWLNVVLHAAVVVVIDRRRTSHSSPVP